jgi:acyl-CoA thioester hydrolase
VSENSDWPFSAVDRVRFGDLDAMQHLNNVEFLRFAETARIAYTQQLIPDFSPIERGSFGYVVAENHIAYHSPVGFGEEIRTRVRPRVPDEKSVRMDFEMHAEGDGRLIAEGHAVLVGYDYGEDTAAPIPDDVRERFAADAPTDVR